MLYEINDYEWELEGDLSCSVWLNFSVKAKCDGVRVWDAEIIIASVECVGVTFSMNRRDLICDGTNSGPALPGDLLNWFEDRFAAKCNQKFVDEIVEKNLQKILN